MSAKRGVESFVEQAQFAIAAGVPILWISTHEEQRALSLLRAVAPGAAVTVWSVTQALESGDADGSAASALSLARRAQEPSLLVMLDLHTQLGDPLVVRSLRDFASTANASSTVIVVSPVVDVPVELDKDVLVLDLPLPDAQSLGGLLDAEMKRRGGQHWEQEPLTTAAAGLTWLEAQRAFRMALAGDDAQEGLRQVVGQKRRALRRSAALGLVEAEVNLDDVGGLDALKGWLRTRLAAFRPEARAFGLPEPRGLMVCGVQGCGKSLVAKASAQVFGLPLVRLDFAAAFASSSPELTVRQAMRAAEAIAPVVLWVDEIEKGLGGDASEGGRARVFGDFLVWLQEKRAPVFVAATANEVEQLPPELVRRGRFDEVFFVDLPAARERAEILSIHLRLRGRDPSRFPVEELTQGADNVSGAELEQAVIAGLFRAFAAGRDLQPDDLRAALVETIPLATMYEERVQALRTWARTRARRASADRRTLELFED